MYICQQRFYKTYLTVFNWKKTFLYVFYSWVNFLFTSVYKARYCIEEQLYIELAGLDKQPWV